MITDVKAYQINWALYKGRLPEAKCPQPHCINMECIGRRKRFNLDYSDALDHQELLPNANLCPFIVYHIAEKDLVDNSDGNSTGDAHALYIGDWKREREATRTLSNIAYENAQKNYEIKLDEEIEKEVQKKEYK